MADQSASATATIMLTPNMGVTDEYFSAVLNDLVKNVYRLNVAVVCPRCKRTVDVSNAKDTILHGKCDRCVGRDRSRLYAKIQHAARLAVSNTELSNEELERALSILRGTEQT